MILSPKRIRSGSRVAIVAPSSPFDMEEVQAGIDIIRECGLEPVLGPCVKNLRTKILHAASVQERAEELNWAFSSPNISAVIAAVGGEGSGAVLPYLDYGVIRASKKAFLGMSDLTAINNGILAKAGLITINGQTPSIRLDKGPKIQHSDSESFRLALELMKSDQAWGSRPFSLNPHFARTVCPGKSSGIVVGGNFDTFVHLLGTPYFPEIDGTILFLEDVHKGGEVISRQMLHLQLAGIFDRISGLVLGEFEDVPKKISSKIPSVEDVILQYCSSGPPCSFGYSFSHGPYTSPIPIGSNCLLNADSGEVFFDFCMSS